MIKRAFIAGLILLTAGSVAVAADSGTKYGKGVTLAAAIPIADLLAKPGDYVGKPVRVDGIVTGMLGRFDDGILDFYDPHDPVDRNLASFAV